jgi:two-component system, OmpR family, phosphate regulon response regulator PhoB
MIKKILIVDDDPDIRLINKSVVEESGHTAIVAHNGEDGFKIIKEQKPDLAILDVLMPRQSGLMLYRKLKTNKSFMEIPVIILSGISKKTFIRSQNALAEFGEKKVPEPEIYMEKPVEPEELMKTIKNILD